MPVKKLTVFIAKRVLICYILLSIIDVVLMTQRWFILVGMFLGVVISLIRFGSYGFVFTGIVLANSVAARKGFSVFSSLAIYVINQLVLIPVLYIAFKFNQYFFAGVFIGIMLLPFTIFINSLTEALGITHNDFE